MLSDALPSSPLRASFRAYWQVRPQGFVIPRPDAILQSVPQFRPATPEERQEVESYYNICPMPGQVIDDVQVTYNPVFEAGFKNRLEWLQSRSSQSAFAKKPWQEDAALDKNVPGKTQQEAKRLREIVADVFAQMSHTDPHYKDIHLMPLWHATKKSIVPSVTTTGFYAFAKLDDGFFGRGLYFTPDAGYAAGVYGSKNPADPTVLLLSWVAAYAVYPVMEWESLRGASQKTSHDTHFVLVKRRTPNPADPNYDAQAPDIQNHYSEVVIFDENACLPRYLVTLKPSMVPGLPPSLGECAFNEGEQQKATNPLLALYHFKRSYNLYDHSPAQGEIQRICQRFPTYQGLWQPFTSSLMHLADELQKQLKHGQTASFTKGLEAFSNTLNVLTGEQPYFPTAKNLENIALASQFSGASPTLKARLLACWNRCLFMGFVQGQGALQPISPQTLKTTEALLVPAQTPESAALQEEFAFLSLTAALFDYQSKNPNDPRLVPMAQQLHQLMTMAVAPHRWSFALDQLAELYSQHPFLSQEHRGLVLLLRALRTNPHVCILEPVVTWVQQHVAQTIRWGQDPACPWLLSLATLQFLLTSLRTAPFPLVEMVLLGDKNRLGLYHWMDKLIALEKGSLAKSWCTDVLCTPLSLSQNTAHRLEPLFASLRACQWDFSYTFQQLSCHQDPALAYPGQQLLVEYRALKGTVTWQDYAELGRKSQALAPLVALRAYDKAKIFLGQEETPLPEASAQLSQALSQLYLKEGQNAAGTHKVAALKFYLQALSESPAPEQVTIVREHLVPTALPLDDNWPLKMRLQTFARPLLPNENTAQLVEEGHTVLQGIFSGNWVIEKDADAQKQLFDGDTIRIANLTTNAQGQRVQEGNHRVACIGAAPHQLHIKENPSCPGLAFGAWSLIYLTFSFHEETLPEVVVPVEPFRILHSRKTFYTQASPTVLGPTFKEALGAPLPALDPLALGILTLAGFLLDPEDARPANFILTPGGQGAPASSLVCIDNDHVWVREAVFEEGTLIKTPRPRVKNILYCMPHMKQAIHPALKKVFVNPPFSSLEILKMWLVGLAFYNEALARVFSSAERAALFNRSNDAEKVLLEAYFHPEQLGRLYTRSMQLKGLLATSGSTYAGVFQGLHPRLAGLYQQVWRDLPEASPEVRFEKLTSGLFTTTGGTKTTNTQLVQMVINKTLKDYAEFEQHRASPQDLIPFLQSFLSHLSHEGAVVEFIVQNLRSGFLTLFQDQPEAQANVLRRIPWQSFPPHILTPTFHQQFLNAMSPDLEEITFKQHPLLTDDDLINLVNRLKRPQALTVAECPKVQGVVPGLFAKSLALTCQKKNIRKLTLLGGPSLKFDTLFEIVKWYGPRLQDPTRPWQIDISPPSHWPVIAVQSWVHRYPQWGMPLQIPDYTTQPPICSAILKGHTGPVYVCAVLPGGRIVSGSDDETLKIWQEKPNGSWSCAHTLEGHTNRVTSCVVLPNGRIVSGSDDKTLKIWQENHDSSWSCAHTLKGRHPNYAHADTIHPHSYRTLQHRHTSYVSARAVLSDGRIVSESVANTGKFWRDDDLIKIWQENSDGSWSDSASLKGHTGSAYACAILPDGRIVVGSSDKITIWQEDGAGFWICSATLEGHTDMVISCFVLPDGRIVSGSDDKTLKIWQEKPNGSWSCAHTLEGHTNRVTSCVLLPDGSIVSGSWDGTLKIWEEDRDGSWSCAHTLEGHTNSVTSCVVLPNGRIVSGSDDKTLKIWSPEEYLPLEKPLVSHKERLFHNFQCLLKWGLLTPQQVPLLLPKELKTLDVRGSVLRAEIKAAILEHCPQVRLVE